MSRSALAPLFLILSGSALVGCSSTDVPLEEFTLSPEVETEVQNAADDGDDAQGSYTFSEETKRLIITIEATSFECNLEVGTLEAVVLELTNTRMVWQFDDGGTAEFVRIDEGDTGIAGVWKTPAEGGGYLYAVLTSDGRATIVGTMVCDNDGMQNGEGCYPVQPAQASITIDGDSSDWASVSSSATIEDAAGDSNSSDPGADFRGLKVASDGTSVFVLLELAGPPSTSFQAREAPNGGTYRLQLRDDTGQDLFLRFAYSEGAMSWMLLEEMAGVEAAAGPDSIEWSLSRGLFGSSITIIRAEVQDCGTPGSPCSTPEDLDRCGFFDL